MAIGREGMSSRQVHGRRVQGRGGHGRQCRADDQARVWGVRGRRLFAARQTWGRGGHDYRDRALVRTTWEKTVKVKERADKEEEKYDRQKKEKGNIDFSSLLSFRAVLPKRVPKQLSRKNCSWR